MAVELRNLLGRAVGRTLPATLTFDHPSVEAIVEHLASDVFARELGAPEALPGSPPHAAPARDVHEEWSTDELAQQLARRLDDMGPLEKG
jgi:hypothetical protein